MDALTICAANYLPFAKVLAKSFIENHPNAKFYLLLVDGDVCEVDTNLVSGMQLVKPSDLDISSEKFLRMTVYYDVTELSTALKPLGLKYLLDNESEIAIYLDPDIQTDHLDPEIQTDPENESDPRNRFDSDHSTFHENGNSKLSSESMKTTAEEKIDFKG